MEQIVLQSLAAQSFPVVLLLLISFLLYKKQLKMEEKSSERISFLEKKVDDIMTNQVEKLTALVMELKDVMHESNTVIQRNTSTMEKVESFMTDNLIVAKKK